MGGWVGSLIWVRGGGLERSRDGKWTFKTERGAGNMLGKGAVFLDACQWLSTRESVSDQHKPVPRLKGMPRKKE